MTSEKRLKRSFWRKTRKKNKTTIVAVEMTTKEITTDNWKLSETAPSCNDCVATIITEQFTRTGKGVGTASPAFRKEIRALFPRIPESGGVSGGELKMFYINF